MGEARPRGPEEQGMVPQGPEDAAEDVDRGVQRRQVINSACSELEDCDFCIGGEKSAMNSGRMYVCSFFVTKETVERSWNCLCWLAVLG